MTLLSVKNLYVFIEDKQVDLLGPISFSLELGENLTIMGETGAGKSLIAQAILGSLPTGLKSRGDILLKGEAIDNLSQKQRSTLWGNIITALPQEPWLSLDPLMRSGQQVAETHRYLKSCNWKEAKKQTVQQFKKLDLSDTAQKRPFQLSGGMAQRVAFAAATAGDAELLLADEPTKGLDSHRHDKILSLLKAIPQKGDSLLTITHDLDLAYALGGKIIILKNGKIVEEGITHTVLSSPKASYTQALCAANPSSWPPLSSCTISSKENILVQSEKLRIGRNKIAFIKGLDFCLKAGESLAISGPSGIGKTSLLDTIIGSIKPMGGTLTRAEHIGKWEIQKLYQDPPTAFPPLISLKDNFKAVTKKHKMAWDQLLQLLENVELDASILKRRPSNVSGGELQRLSFIRALIAKPKILLADEPTSRLDLITQETCLNLFKKLCREENIGIILVTHNQHIAEKWAHNHIDLNQFCV